MKYLHCKFINYIGIYNGMGLTEISIDFTKCIHNTPSFYTNLNTIISYCFSLKSQHLNKYVFLHIKF